MVSKRKSMPGGRWQIIKAFDTDAAGNLVGTPVDHPTIIQDWTDVGELIDVLQVTLVNLDPTNNATLVVEFTEDGEHADAEATGGTAPPLQSTTSSIGPNDLQSVFRLTAHSDSPDYPTVNVAWQVKGRIAKR